mgnify:CR=1 FL=1
MMTNTTPDQLPGMAQRVLQAQLEISATATGRGAFGVPFLAAAISAAFCQLDVLGRVPAANGVAFTGFVTLWALVALWLFYRILCSLTRTPAHPAGNWPLAWLLCAFYAVTYFFWYYATTTEQYSSAVAQTLGIVYVYLLWAGKREEAKAQPASHHAPFVPHLLLLLAFLCGLSLAHMLTVAFIVPPIVAVVLWQAPALLRSPQMVIGAVLAACPQVAVLATSRTANSAARGR